MNTYENPLLRSDRRSVAFGSFSLVTYGIIQVFIALFAIKGAGLDLIIYAFGIFYILCGIVGILASKGNGFGLIKCFKAMSYIIVALNFFLIVFCGVACFLILTKYNKKCKKNSEFCEEKRPPDDIGIVIIFAIPVVISLASICYLRILLKFVRLMENDMYEVYNRVGFIPSSV
jgi:hypothetical protein